MNNKELMSGFLTYIKAMNYSIIYVSPIRAFIGYCTKHSVDLTQITHAQVMEFILSLRALKISNGTINTYFKALRFFYSYLSLSGVNLVKPEVLALINSFKLLSVDRKIKHSLTLKEIEYIVSQAITYHETMPPEKIRAILYFMFYTGVRRGELINLKRDDINLSERQALIRVPTKNKDEKYVYFPTRIAMFLQAYFAVEPEEENAFNMSRSKMLCFFNFLKNFTSKGKNISPHILRHSFAHHLARSSVDVRIAQKLLGHRSIHSTLIYYDPNQEVVKEIYLKQIGK